MSVHARGKQKSPRFVRAATGGVCLALVVTFSARAATDLTSLSLEDLMNLTVVGASKYAQKQSEVAAAVSIITRDEIRTFGWRTLAEALSSLPGIHTTNDRQYTYLGTRGFGLPGDLTARVLININGNRVNDPVYDGGPAGREFPLDLALVERIEFIPGPGGAVYGQNAMFGVVNVITRTGEQVNGGELEAGIQSPQRLSAGRASWGRRLDNDVDLLVSVSGLSAAGEDRFFDYGKAGKSGVAAGLDAERNQKFYARMSRGRWAFELVQGSRDKKDPTAAFFNDPLVVPGDYFTDRYTLAQLQFQDSLMDDTLQVSARLFAGSYRYDGTFTYSGNLVSSPGQGDWQGTEWRALSTAVADHKLMLGFEAQNNQRTDQSILYPANPAQDVTIARSGYRVGLYAQDEWQIGKSLSMTLGLRVDNNDSTGTSTSPRAALIWQATPATTLKALYGRAHRAPNVYESQYTDGLSQVSNPTLGGERIDTLELVADHRIGADLVLRGSVYEWTMRDIVTLGIDPASANSQPPLTQYQSGDTVKANGLELAADKTWRWGGRLRASLSLQRVHSANGTKQVNSPQVLGKLNFSTPLAAAGLRLGYELQYDSERRALDGSDLGAYAVSNLYLSTDKLARGLEVGFGIRNLFDKRYEHPAADTNWQNALAQDGRSVRLQATYKF